MDEMSTLVAVNIGSSRIAVSRIEEGTPGSVDVVAADDIRGARALICSAVGVGDSDASTACLVVASVNPVAERALLASVADLDGLTVRRMGHDLPIPQPHMLGDDHTTGQDRLLNALAAYDLFKEACAVVDAGTAITVDFVDGEGVYHGGAIAPGGRLQLQSLHDGTASLPVVALARPEDESNTFAKTTPDAMLHGVYFGVRGMVRTLVERYAERFGAYPHVIATGGDAALFFEDDDFVEVIVPDLTLRGIALTTVAAVADHPGASRG